MSTTELAVALAGALSSGLAVPQLTGRGLRQLGRPELTTRALRIIGAGVGAVVGATTALTALRTGNGTLALPLVVWGATLAAASCCDAVSQRIPTGLVRQSIVGLGLLLTSAFALYQDWSALLTTLVAAVAAGLVLLVCWRVAGAGFGDVRLAVLGGLGLGHATPSGLLVGLATFAVIIVTQAVVTVVGVGDRRTRFPYGPALATGFFVAAVTG